MGRNENDKISFEAGKYYTIHHYEKGEVVDLVHINDDNTVWCSFITEQVPYSSFVIGNDSTLYLWEYFYTPKEIRQLKLKKFNEI